MARHCIDAGSDSEVLEGASCAFGVFDGLHRGHRFLIDEAIVTAVGSGGRSAAITFSKDPDEVFARPGFKRLMTDEERLAALEASGVDELVVLPATSELFSMQPAEFLDRFFGQSAPAHLHVGEDFRFGANASGTVQDIFEWASANAPDMHVHAHPLLIADGKPITATRIRELLQAGQVEQANELLGHPYSFAGVVQSGYGRGHEMGVATANVNLAPEDRVLEEGVYAGRALVEGQMHPAAICIGKSPTFQPEIDVAAEVHILDFDGDLLGKQIRVIPAKYLRPNIKFSNTDDLIAQITADIEAVRNLP